MNSKFANSPPGTVIAPCSPTGKTDEVKIPSGCSYLDGSRTLILAPKQRFKGQREKYTLGLPTCTTHKFPGDKKPSAAIQHTVLIDGQSIDVFTSAGETPPNKTQPSVDSIAKSLAATPKSQRKHIRSVEISSKANPHDAYWEKQYNIPGFTSAATASGDNVTYYPGNSSSMENQDEIDRIMLHESGHIFHDSLWTDTKRRADWQAAIDADKKLPSKYAGSSIKEDFAESVAMYSLSKGTKCESTARQLYPHRYAELDKLTSLKK